MTLLCSLKPSSPIACPTPALQVEGGDGLLMQEERAARVSFTNHFSKALTEVVLTVEGSGLLLGKRDTR